MFAALEKALPFEVRHVFLGARRTSEPEGVGDLLEGRCNAIKGYAIFNELEHIPLALGEIGHATLPISTIGEHEA